MFRRPSCTSPTIIFNRAVVPFLLESNGYYLCGKFKDVPFIIRSHWRYDFPFKMFSKIAHTFKYKNYGDFREYINWKGLETSYVIDKKTCEKQYLFLAVPCGHCDLCCDTRHNDFVSRCFMENQTSKTRPIMVTLTYDSASLPFVRSDYKVISSTSLQYDYISDFGFRISLGTAKKTPILKLSDDIVRRNVPYVMTSPDFYEIPEPYKSSPHYAGLRPILWKRDVQLFLKRLRINWHRRGLDDAAHPFRYCCFGEYGKKRQRPHFHLIMWNVPYDIVDPLKSSHLLKQLHADVMSAWKMSDPLRCQVEIARDASSYVSKYISKNLSDDKNGCMLCSNRNGGIGYPFLATQLDYLRKHPEVTSISYTDKWSGKTITSTLGRYVTRKVFPSPASLVPTIVKKISRYNDYLLSLIAALTAKFDQYDVYKQLANTDIFIHQFSRYIPHSFTPSTPLPTNLTYLPTFYMYIELLDDIISTREWLLSYFESNAIFDLCPSVATLSYFDTLRVNHFKFLNQLNPTDDSIYLRSLHIRQKKALQNSKLKL